MKTLKNTFLVLLGAGITTFLLLGVMFSKDWYSALSWSAIVTGGAAFVTAFRILTSSTKKDITAIGAHPFDMDDEQQAAIVNMVYGLAEKAGMQKMPLVGWLPSNDINAFAFGRPTDGAVIFFSGILNALNPEDLESIAAHEITHLVSGDAVSKQAMFAAIQGISYVLLAPIYFLAFIASMILGETGYVIAAWLGNIVSRVFGFFGFTVAMWFSRIREYGADKGGADLTTPEQMSQALTALETAVKSQPQQPLNPLMAALCITSPMGIWGEVMSTHPKMQKRISALTHK